MTDTYIVLAYDRYYPCANNTMFRGTLEDCEEVKKYYEQLKSEGSGYDHISVRKDKTPTTLEEFFGV